MEYPLTQVWAVVNDKDEVLLTDVGKVQKKMLYSSKGTAQACLRYTSDPTARVKKIYSSKDFANENL
jgi:hypothetical protein